MHEVLKANPAWSAYEAQGQALAEKRDALVRHVFDAKAPHERAVIEHKAAVADAVESGEVPPLAPDPPDLRHLDEADALLRIQMEAHAARRVEVLAEAADDLLTALRDREGVDNAGLAMLAPEVHRFRARRVADLALYAQIVGAQDKHAGLSVHPSRQERVPREVTTDALLNAAEADVSLLGSTPVGGADRRVMLDDGSDDSIRQIAPRRLGLSSRSFGGDISSWPREQRLPPGRV